MYRIKGRDTRSKAAAPKQQQQQQKKNIDFGSSLVRCAVATFDFV